MTKSTTLPTHVDVVVIGGGIVGCSTAYHLARDHKLSVIVLEQNKITSGSTWHAAGLVGQLRGSASITQLLKYSVDLYKKLEGETGLQTGWKMNGCLRLARTPDRWTEFKRLSTTARSFGMEMELLSPEETARLWPLMNTNGLIGSSFLPTDGQASPSDITQALAKGARMQGAQFFQGARVESFDIVNDRIVAINTNQGQIFAEKIVNCAGIWSRQLGKLAGVNIPIQAIKHQYVITEKMDGLSPTAPTIRDPDLRTYFKEEVGGLSFGGYEPNPMAWDVDTIPHSFEFQLFEDDWDHFEQHMKAAMQLVPSLNTVGIKKMINGPESFTPDGNFILGRAPELHNFFVGCGFNAFGIAAGGGAGWALASWVADGEAPSDLWPVDIRRFSAAHKDGRLIRDRTLEAYGKHYAVAFPHEEYESARPLIKSPLYDVLCERGAVMGSKLGWERANWFAQAGGKAQDHYSMGRQNWFERVGEEHRAVREAAGLFDQSSFAKFEIKGRLAERCLSWLCANDVSKPPGKVTYTQLLNSRGGIECDLTVARLASDHYYLVTGTGFRTHDFTWIKENIKAKHKVNLSDVTDAFGTLVLMGPKSRTILERITISDVSNAVFPFATVRIIEIAGVQARAMRITYVGELGWELHVPMEGLRRVFDAIVSAGEPHGLRLTGYRAIESLRLEKGYRAWSSDITPNDTPFEAGLGWAVKIKGDENFLGRKAIEQKLNTKPAKMLTCFTTERDDIVLVGRETILRNGTFSGYLTSAGYGYTIGKPIGLGYVRNGAGIYPDYVMSGDYQLVVANETVKAIPTLKPLYDSGNQQVKG